MINALEIRKSLRWSQERMALHLGCDQATVSRMERGGPVNGPISRLLVQLLGDIAAGRILPSPKPAKPMRGHAHTGASAPRAMRARAAP